MCVLQRHGRSSLDRLHDRQTSGTDLERPRNGMFIANRDSPLFHKRLSKLHLDINSFVFRLLAFPFAIAHRGDSYFCFTELQ